MAVVQLIVPKRISPAWQPHLGVAASLVAASGKLRRVAVTQRRVALVVAYSLRLCQACGLTPDTTVPKIPRSRQPPVVQSRRQWLRLLDLDVFAAGSRAELTLHPELVRFAARVTPRRALELVQWAPPRVAYHPRTGRALVYSNQLTTALARYVAPEAIVSTVVYTRPPPRQLSFTAAAMVILKVFNDFTELNRETLCRFAKTSVEAGLLVERSVNSAAVVRKRLGELPV